MIDDFSFAIIMLVSLSGWCVASFWRFKYWHLYDSLDLRRYKND